MFGPSQMGTVTATRKRAYPDSLTDASTNYLTGLLQGDYLHGGPGFNEAMNAAQNDIQPRVQSAFNSGGRLNSGLAQEAMSSGLADAFANLYGQERQLQSLGALQTSPVTETSETPYFGNDLASALGIGSSLIGLGQGLFGDSDGGLFGGISDIFGGNSGGAGGGFGDIFGGDSGGGLGLPPGSSNVMNTALGNDGFPGFTDFFGGGGSSGGAASISPVLGQLGGPGGAAFGLGAGALPAGFGSAAAGSAAPAGFGLSQALAPGAAASGGTVGAAAGSAPGALSGLSSLALPAAFAAPLLMGIAGSIGRKSSEREAMAPILNNIAQGPLQNFGNGVRGVAFTGPDGQSYVASPAVKNNPKAGDARAISTVYNPQTGKFGYLSPNGFYTNEVADLEGRNYFGINSGSQSSRLDEIRQQMRADELAYSELHAP